MLDQFSEMFQESEKNAFETIFDNEIISIGFCILEKTLDKVRIRDDERGYWRNLSKDEICNSVKNYLASSWNIKINHSFQLLNILIVIASIISAIITNNKISQFVFIPIVCVFSIISFCTAAYTARVNRNTYDKNKKERDEQSIIVNDVMRIPEIVSGDILWRLKRLKNSNENTKKNMLENRKKSNQVNIIESAFEFVTQCVLIIMYTVALVSQGNEITVSIISDLIANLAIVETALKYVREMGFVLTNFSENANIVDSETDRVNAILDVYYKEVERTRNPKHVESISIKPFTVNYEIQSENDKAFTLCSNNTININCGEVAILYGPSGTGKSTLINLITDRISFEKSIDIPSTSRSLIYDEKLHFGSFDIWTELFCASNKKDLEKMQKILENLHLWQEMSSNCQDVWKWMMEHKCSELSNGQKQRLILAKMLYHLDKEIDILVFDEATSGLDDKSNDANNADAEKILKFLIEYCNRDKKRIIIISTHQNIDGVKKALSAQYPFKRFLFERDGEKSHVSEF